ncbi:hypothetical protein [Nonomuraea sp. NPDC049158]|uniref:hypothetical protein n=1 Tax=Nonomuraea sp. NPDC049158 TaxID=3155649 RepID=UPI0033D7CE51
MAFTKVVRGISHSMAIDDDGSLWTWGSNDAGQLGDGTLTDHTTPIKVQGLPGTIVNTLRHERTLRRSDLGLTRLVAWGVGVGAGEDGVLFSDPPLSQGTLPFPAGGAGQPARPHRVDVHGR